MKKNYILLFICYLFVTLDVQLSKAQCVIDSTQTQAGIHPDSLTNGYVNQFYSEDVTFVLITDTLGFNISNFLISSINGLPQGIQWTCNHASNGCNYNPNVSLYGCVRIFGTPLLAGTYPLSITVVATVAFVGNQTFNFNSQLIIEPAVISNSGFSMTNALGCSPLTVTFSNNIPSAQYYHWDFGNGDTSNSENPAAVTYLNSGDYVVQQSSILDTITKYYLSSIKVDSIPNNAGFLDTPDMYIIIKNQAGSVVYDSHPSVSNTNPPLTFSLANFQLSNETYTVFVWDEDSGLTAPDDPLGQVSFGGHTSSGIAYDVISGVGGKLKLEYTIQKFLPIITTAIDTVHVYPGVNSPQINASGPVSFCDGDTVLINSNNNIGNQWYKNGNLMVGETNTTLIVTSSGSYFDLVTNSFGCSDTSAAINVNVYFLPPYPNFSVFGNQLNANVFGTFTYQWYLNDTAIVGATNSTHIALVSGNYRLQITDTNGCSRKSFPIAIVVTGLSDLMAVNNLQLFPNPVTTELNITLSNHSNGKIELIISDVLGNVIYTQKSENNNPSYSHSINVETWAKGVYFIKLSVNKENFFKKVVLE